MNDGLFLIVKDFEIFYRLFSVFLVVASDDQLYMNYVKRCLHMMVKVWDLNVDSYQSVSKIDDIFLNQGYANRFRT